MILPSALMCIIVMRYVQCSLHTGHVHYNNDMGLDIQKKVSEYDQEIPQSQTADKPTAPRGRATQPPRDTRKTNQAKQPALSSPSR